MATRAWQPSPDRRTVDELTVHRAVEDLLTIEPLDLGPATPATRALTLERGPEPNGPSPHDA
jgi:hypothetical protein